MENFYENETTDLPASGGIISNIKDMIFRTVIFSQKDRVKDLVLTIVEKSRDYTVDWVNENWDAIFDKLAALMGLTLIPQDECPTTFGLPERYACEFDPNNLVLVPEDENAESIASFLLWLVPIIVKLWL